MIVGIVNMTADSFSDGGRYLEPAKALVHARALLDAGAQIIELGPASSHPDARHVTPEEQIRRLEPVLLPLMDMQVPVSVDATIPVVQRFAVNAGVAMLNDVRGFRDEAAIEAALSSPCRIVVVHSMSRAERADRSHFSPPEVLESIDRFFGSSLERLVAAGIAEDRIVLDPGLGFFLGNDPEASFQVLRGLAPLRTRFGRPLLISPSRKSFLQRAVGREPHDLLAATLAAELWAAAAGVDYIRTHDVGALGDALTVARRLGAAA